MTSFINKMTDDLDDHTQEATVVLLNVAMNGKFNFERTPGEVTGYICQWNEQKTKRRFVNEIKIKIKNLLKEAIKETDNYQNEAGVSVDDMLIAGQTRRIEEYRGTDVIDIFSATEKGGRKERAITETLTSSGLKLKPTAEESLLKPASADGLPGERRTAQVLDLKAKTYHSRAKAVRSTDVFRAADGQEG